MTKFTGSILGMGNPLLDITADVGEDFLKKYNVELDTAVLATEEQQPLFGELVEKYPVKYIAGGATQNTCRVAQWMLGQPNQQVAFFGCVGNDDEYAKQLESCASSDGVFVHYMKDKEAPTGTCAALIVNTDRTLVTNLHAANNFKPSHLETDTAKEILDSAKIYYSAGFFLTVSVESLVQVSEHMLKANKTVCLNLSAPFIIEFFKDQLATALEYADYVFGNESEAATYAKVHGLDETDLKAVALAISAGPKKNSEKSRTAVITQGSKSTIVAVDGNVTEYAVEALDSSKLVDTNGAGDAFVGGFLSQLVQAKSMEDAVNAGHYAAKHIIQVSGTTLDSPCEYK